MSSRAVVAMRAAGLLALFMISARHAGGQQPVSQAGAAADPLNLDFERSGLINPATPAKWGVGGQGYVISLDSTVVHSGTRSLRMQAPATRAPNSFGVANEGLPAKVVAGHTLKLRGYIRTADVTQGYAGMWMRVDAGTRTLALDNMSMRGVTGSKDWAPYEITMHADSSATAVYIGPLFPGNGTAWFDSFSLEIDGRPYTAEAVTPWRASDAESRWVRDHAIPLSTSDPKAALDDLRPIGAIVGNARFVSLGEGTHGTSEFFAMKHRLTRYLAENKGFTVFAIEANMPEARRVNEYVLTGRGDPKAALAGLYFWTWNTQEVLDMIEWMRQYNASGKGHMEFWGFDLQTPQVAMDSVRAFVRRADAGYVPTLDSAYGQIDAVLRERAANVQSVIAVGNWEREAERVFARLRDRRDAYVAAGNDSLDVAWAIQNARIVAQAARSTRGNAPRDSAMAANVQWIADHQPAGTRMVLWAHNGHVGREPNWMGAHLAQRYGDSLRVIGFSLGDGDFRAVGPRGITSYPAAAPQAGSLEEVFRATKLPRFALDLRGTAGKPESAFLSTFHDFRSIGAMATDSQFFPINLARQFDAVIYFDHTSASARIP